MYCLVGNTDNRRLCVPTCAVCVCVCGWVCVCVLEGTGQVRYVENLYLLLNFDVNLKLLFKNKY